MQRCMGKASGPSAEFKYPPRCPNDATSSKLCEIHFTERLNKMTTYAATLAPSITTDVFNGRDRESVERMRNIAISHYRPLYWINVGLETFFSLNLEMALDFAETYGDSLYRAIDDNRWHGDLVFAYEN